MNVAYPMGRSCGWHQWQELEALLGAALACGLGHQPMGRQWREFSERGLPCDLNPAISSHAFRPLPHSVQQYHRRTGTPSRHTSHMPFRQGLNQSWPSKCQVASRKMGVGWVAGEGTGLALRRRCLGPIYTKAQMLSLELPTSQHGIRVQTSPFPHRPPLVPPHPSSCSGSWSEAQGDTPPHLETDTGRTK